MNDNEWFTKEQYTEWAKTRKQFIVDYGDIHVNNGFVMMDVRVGDHSIKIGDCMSSATVLKIQAYGKDLEETGAGLTCRLTLDQMPTFLVQETPPDFFKWIKEHKELRKQS
jgi:hypothetical protein